ncbi:MAG: hypothetical protein AB7H88_07055 [Vicinamibacterales bacterium]
MDSTSGRDAVGAGLAAGGLLLVPLLAMQVTDEVNWGPGDFALAWTLLAGAGLAWQWVARRTGGAARAAAGLAVSTALLLVWVNLAVGLIGDEGNPANLLFGGVIAVAVAGALAARFEPRGMARALAATAAAQVLVGVVAAVAGLDGTGSAWSPGIVMGTVCFTGLWLAAAWLFQRAGQQTRGARA